MPSWIFWLFVLIYFIIYGGADFGMKTADNYGPYVAEWHNCTTCRGPKSVNLSIVNTSVVREPNGYYRYEYNTTYLENVLVDEVKMKVFTVKEGKKTLLWSVNAKQPCTHYMLAAIFEKYFEAPNCLIKKGTLHLNMPMSEICYKYTGESFFYGDFIFKVVVLTKKANLACLIFDPKFKKKTTH